MYMLFNSLFIYWYNNYSSRNCIGKTFAQQEMRLSIANLIKLFDFEAIPEQVAAGEERRTFLTLQVKSNSYKVLMKRRTTA